MTTAEEQYGKMASDMEVCVRCVIGFLHVEKLHPLTFIDACRTFTETNSGCGHSEVVGGAFQQW
jgi:hypothetical protein